MVGSGPSPDVYFPGGGPGDPRLPPGGGSRRPRNLGGDASERNVWIAVASTAIFFGVLAIIVVRSPGWPDVKQSFFNGQEFKESFPVILRKFVRNIQIFCIAEMLVLSLALFLAVLRSLPGPVFTPLRILSAAYTDLFRGLPTILVILLLLNDFIGLQKDSALVYVLGVVEGLSQATIIQAGDFNFTPLVALSVIYVAITIPQARFVDRMIARDQRRRQAGATL